MIEIYRSGNGDGCFDRYQEICRDCAKEEVLAGAHVEYDLYLSERTEAINIHRDFCEICGGDFFRDGRKNFIRLDGVVY